MKITYVSNSTLFSGDANAVHVACMCAALAGAGHAVRLRARRAAGDGTIAQYYGLRHRFEVAFENRLTHGLWLAARALDPRRLFFRDISEQRIYYGRNVPAMRWLGRLGYPVALELHFVPRPAKLRMVERLVEKSRRFLGLVVISEALRREIAALFPQLPAEAIFVARDGFRAASLRVPALRAEAGPVRAVYMGSFHQGKGMASLMAAAARLPEVEFHAFGGTPEQIANARLQAPANVLLHGRIAHSEVATRLSEFDIALAPYSRVVHGAGQKPGGPNLAQWMSPLKLFEYMAAGLPIITSDLPVVRELLTADQTALLIEPDDAEALAAAIRSLADDPPLRLRLAQAANLGLASHTWDDRTIAIADFLQRRLQVLKH